MAENGATPSTATRYLCIAIVLIGVGLASIVLSSLLAAVCVFFGVLLLILALVRRAGDRSTRET